MNSKVLSFILGVLLVGQNAYADTCSDNLVKSKLFSSGSDRAFCDTFATSIPTDASFLTGKTVAIQEATSASACSGTVTANGTTSVLVSTTCAITGSRIFISRTSAPSGTAICWTTGIVNGASFDFDCSAAETGTFNWVILHEAA